MFAPLDPLDPTTLPNNPALANWQEHQRRQRTLRMLMMFLMVLLLMDGDEPVERRNRTKTSHSSLRNHSGLDGGKWDRTRYGNFRVFLDENGDLINPLTWGVWKSRREEDALLYDAVAGGSRYGDLMRRNIKDYDGIFKKWAESKVVVEAKSALGIDVEKVEKINANEREDSLLTEEQRVPDPITPDNADDEQIFHYPRNATGYYRGLWMRVPRNSSSSVREKQPATIVDDETFDNSQDVSSWIQDRLEQSQQDVGIFVLPSSRNTTIKSTKPSRASSKNTTLDQNDASSTLTLTKSAGRAAFQLYSRPIPAMTELSIVDGLVKLYDGMTTSFVSRRTDVLLRVRGVIIHGNGKLSLVSSSINDAASSSDGKIRSYLGIKQIKKSQSDAIKVENSKDGDLAQSKETFAQIEEENVDEITDRQRHRRLQDLLNAFLSQPGQFDESQNTNAQGLIHDGSSILRQIRVDILELYASSYVHEILPMDAMKEDGWTVLKSAVDGDSYDLQSEIQTHRHQSRLLQSNDSSATSTLASQKDVDRSEEMSMNTHHTKEQVDQFDEEELNDSPSHDDGPVSRMAAVASEEQPTDDPITNDVDKSIDASDKINNQKAVERTKEPQYSYPFPYVCDDANESIKKSSSPNSRRLPARELLLEANAAHCEFEMNIDIHEQPWTFGEWRNAVLQRFRTVQAFNPYLHKFDRETERLKRSQILNLNSQVGFIEDSVKEALIMTMSGTVESVNCNFTSFVNVTAIRTNWEHTTAKAINYSFYMMLTCLCQIVVLLRQLLHTQAQSAASNVSLFCIGWQTVLDAILCIAHIFLCLVMQPLFTAFASVAFFKLLIFCVIEMKYMALIIQARNNANNPNHTQDDLRRQITLLHLRFYAAFMLAIMSFWYIGQTHRTVYILMLYSFWVPQIVLNAITEARKPMHSYYIYGMSATRIIAPTYVFAVRNNFLKEVNPDFPSDPQMCQLLILWILIQTALLVGQGKYGARFMIPQRFLPPKFDYHRPIPSSILPPPPPPAAPSNGSPSSEIELGPLLNSESSPRGARHRRPRLGSRVDESSSSNGTTTMSTDVPGDAQTLDCVICYNEIDINDRSGYMLAPCLHIFHTTCLEQWMEVKMECPICRCNLPAI